MRIKTHHLHECAILIYERLRYSIENQCNLWLKALCVYSLRRREGVAFDEAFLVPIGINHFGGAGCV